MKYRFLFAGALFALFGANIASAQSVYGSVSGRLLDDKGKPIVGGQVTITPCAGSPCVAAASAKPVVLETDKKGAFNMERIVPGEYLVSFFKEGLNKSQGTIKIDRGQPRDLGDIKLQPLAPDKTLQIKEALEMVDKGDYEGAKAKFEDFITKDGAKIKPTELAKLEFDLGIVYEKLKDWPNAEIHYKKTLELDPSMTQAYGGLGNIYQQMNRPDEAINLFEAAAKAHPEDGGLAYDLGLFLWTKGKNEDAFDALSKAAVLLPTNPEIQYHLGVTAISLSKNDEAVKYLQKYLTMNPTNKDNIESAKTLIPAIQQTSASNAKTKK
jgi:tetratricopeptide (TPR) repeat protein